MYGVAKVLSTTSSAPAAFVAAATAAMSTRFSSGFVGDSIQTSRAPATWDAGSDESCSGVAYVKRYPFGSYTCENIRYVPP